MNARSIANGVWISPVLPVTLPAAATQTKNIARLGSHFDQ